MMLQHCVESCPKTAAVAHEYSRTLCGQAHQNRVLANCTGLKDSNTFKLSFFASSPPPKKKTVNRTV